jgi:hypothetical protein
MHAPRVANVRVKLNDIPADPRRTVQGQRNDFLPYSGGLRILQDTPRELPVLVLNQRPLLTIDVWEHAYYLDVQNRRADYAKGRSNISSAATLPLEYDRLRPYVPAA